MPILHSSIIIIKIYCDELLLLLIVIKVNSEEDNNYPLLIPYLLVFHKKVITYISSKNKFSIL